MAIYLFILLTLAQLCRIIGCVGSNIPGRRVIYLTGMLLTLPPYVWFGWYSGLIF